MAQCEWAMLVGLQLCWASFVYDYSESETNMSNVMMKIHFHSTNCFVWIGLTCNQFLESQIDTCYLRNLLNCAFLFFSDNHDNKFKAPNTPEIFGLAFTHYLTIAF